MVLSIRGLIIWQRNRHRNKSLKYFEMTSLIETVKLENGINRALGVGKRSVKKSQARRYCRTGQAEVPARAAPEA